MANEEKSALDKFRDLYLPTVREYEKKIGDAIMYFTPPNLRPIVRGIGAFAPFQNIPNLAPVIEDPSLENIGKFGSDMGITAMELFPPTLVASKVGVLPGKVAQELTETTTKAGTKAIAKNIEADYVSDLSNLINKKMTSSEIAEQLIKKYGKDGAQEFGKKYKDDIFNAVFSKMDNIDSTTPQELAKTFIELGISSRPAKMTDAMKGQYWRNALTTFGKIANKNKDSTDEISKQASENYTSLTKGAMSESGKKTASSMPIESIRAGQASGVVTKRLANINEYYPNLQKEMIDGGLTIDEAVVKLAGRDLAPSTKNYQIIGKFYNLADDMKLQNPKLYDFFSNEVKAYQIGNFTGKKIKHGTKEYEAARKELAKKLNIDVKDIDRAHSMMAPRLAKLSKLIDEGVLTVEEAKRLSKPQYFLLNADNLKHVQLENKLDTLLQRKANLLAEKDFPSVNKTQEAIEKVTKEMEELGVKSELFDPIKKLIKVFGREPTPVEMKKKLINKSEGGMATMEYMTRPLDGQR